MRNSSSQQDSFPGISPARAFSEFFPHLSNLSQASRSFEEAMSVLGIKSGGENPWDPSYWRRGWESNPRIKVLQTSPLPLGYRASILNYIENLHHVSGESAHIYAIVARKVSLPAPRCIRLNSLFDGFFDLGFPQESRSLFRRRRVDVKACAPLKARHLGQFGNDFDVPMVMIVDLFPDRRSVDHEVVSRAVQHRVHAHQGVFQHVGQG